MLYGEYSVLRSRTKIPYSEEDYIKIRLLGWGLLLRKPPIITP